MREAIGAPGLGLVEEVTLVEWHVADGQLVHRGDVLLTIETEKAQVEIEAPTDGVVQIEIAAGPDLVRADIPFGYLETDPE
jgi:pyruvate dehydrogenase E2 component (dihydrolipoamide acetyltransferase)